MTYQITILDRVTAALKAAPNQTCNEIAVRIGAPSQQVSNVLQILRRRHQAACEKNGRSCVWRLERVPKAPALAQPERVTKMHGVYTGPELRRPAGVDAARFAAFALPSRQGTRLYYPDGRVEVVA